MELDQEDKDFCTYVYIAEACKVVCCILDMDNKVELSDKINKYVELAFQKAPKSKISNNFNPFGSPQKPPKGWRDIAQGEEFNEYATGYNLHIENTIRKMLDKQ